MTAPAVSLPVPSITGPSDSLFARLRAEEYTRLDAGSQAYLDFTGSALYPESSITAHAQLLRRSIFGNPHSENGPSRFSTAVIDEARSRLLTFLDASEEDYVVCFTANTSAAIKLVGESFPFGPQRSLLLSADNHNSMNGLRELAKARHAPVTYVPLDRELRLQSAEDRLRKAGHGGLFGFPAQSNFSGVKHPLELIDEAQKLGHAVLLDAAAYLPTNSLSLRQHPADFVAMSLYKIMGYPTGVGALVARRESLATLHRPWFAGGTVEYASVQHGSHLLRERAEGFEDGTPAFLNIAAVAQGLDFIERIGMPRISARVSELTSYMMRALLSLEKKDGAPLVRIYGPWFMAQRGGTVAFNVLDAENSAVPFARVVNRAREAGVSLRGGCFCNPGAAERAFDFPDEATRRCLDRANVDGFSIENLAECLGPSVAVGAVRASVGIPTNRNDIDRAIDVIRSFTET